MAFPVIEGTAESAVTTAGTNHLVTLPASIASTDLVLVLMDIGSTSATLNALTGWTEDLDESAANGLKILRYTGAGVPSNPTFVSSASTRSASIAYRISGASKSVAPQIGTTATGTSTTPNPPSVTPTGGISRDYLFIAFFGSAGEEADDDTWVNSPPTNFTPATPLQKTAGTAGTNLGGLIGAASRQLTTGAAQDPGTFSIDTSAAWRAQTIIVHPISQGSGTGSIDWSGSSTGAAVLNGSGSGAIAWAGASTGVRTPKGAGTGAITWAGSADGVAPVVVMDGNATGAISWAGTAAGATAHRGDATGSITWAGSAGGFVAHRGASTGAVTWTGSSTGEIDVEGAASGNITWVGSANGAAPSLGPKEGFAAGAITWTGSANGETPPVPMHEGAAVGAVAWVGVATGQMPNQGPWWFPAPVAYARNGGGYQGARPGYVKRIPGYTNGGG